MRVHIFQPVPDHERWTDEAIAGLVGQRATVTKEGADTGKKGTIVSAWRTESTEGQPGIMLEMDISE